MLQNCFKQVALSRSHARLPKGCSNANNRPAWICRKAAHIAKSMRSNASNKLKTRFSILTLFQLVCWSAQTHVHGGDKKIVKGCRIRMSISNVRWRAFWPRSQKCLMSYVLLHFPPIAFIGSCSRGKEKISHTVHWRLLSQGGKSSGKSLYGWFTWLGIFAAADLRVASSYSKNCCGGKSGTNEALGSKAGPKSSIEGKRPTASEAFLEPVLLLELDLAWPFFGCDLAFTRRAFTRGTPGRSWGFWKLGPSSSSGKLMAGML